MIYFMLTILWVTSLCFGEQKLFPIRNGAQTRIIGGQPTYVTEFPFAAAINVQTPESSRFCGGALYRTQWIITAGQCVDGATLFTIRLGTNSLRDDDPSLMTLATSIYYLHPDYNPETLENDIGLIKFRLPINHTDYIKSFDLLGLGDMSIYTTLRAIGWGQTSDQDSSLSSLLNVAYVTALDNSECKITYGSQLKDNMVCVAGSYNQGTCHGDTGSPLVEIYSRGLTVHDGVASFVSANGCESPDPSGYTRTYPYNDWIRNITET